jgi:diketogulonate reductase-like aldo/keto reductase
VVADIPTKVVASGFALPALGVGTWRMGVSDDAADVRALRRAIDLGVRHIDTAEGYAGGHAERLVAEAIRGCDRAELFLVSKVSPDHLRYGDVRRSAESSLKRLGTDYLDLYLIHHPNPGIALAETMRALDELVDDGTIRAIGVSNFAPDRLRAAQAEARNPVVANQVHYSLRVREPERSGLLEYCQQNDVLVVAWRPLEYGALADRGDPLLAELAGKYERTPAQIALNWLLVQPAVAAVVKARSIAHLEEDLGAVGWELEAADVERLRHEYAPQRPISDAVPLR